MDIYTGFNLFWCHFYELNPQRKTDKSRCKELWESCNFSDRKKAAIQDMPRRSKLLAIEYLKIKLTPIFTKQR